MTRCAAGPCSYLAAPTTTKVFVQPAQGLHQAKQQQCCWLQKMVFRRHKVQAVVQAAVLEKVKGLSYDPVKGAQVSICNTCLFSQVRLLCIRLTSAPMWAACQAIGRHCEGEGQGFGPREAQNPRPGDLANSSLENLMQALVLSCCGL